MKAEDPSLLARITDSADRALWLLESCYLCPRNCGVNRLAGEVGLCKMGYQIQVAAYGPHFGEEASLVGKKGSGAIFFVGCNLHCVFCQNAEISSGVEEGITMDASQLAGIMLDMQDKGCCNINLITPSHLVPQILDALQEAVCKGLVIPIVYNSSGYDSVETLRLLDGIVSIYMPDCKFWLAESAAKYLGAVDYPEVMRKALLEMYRQVGDLVMNEQGVAVQGLLVRHLVMPGFLDETETILQFLAAEISKDTFVHVMDQYQPCHREAEFSELNKTAAIPG